MRFHDPEAIDRLRMRLAEIANRPIDWLFGEGLDEVAQPDLALVNLERWLQATGSPSMYLDQLVATRARPLLTILGACQPLADALIQNPELASLVFDPAESYRRASRREIIEEGERLLRSASSFTHALDRLRFLRQRWTLTITLNDLAETWDQETVWHAISDLADGLIALARDLVWDKYAREREVAGPCPVLVVAFGKLAGFELNYSSDVDLVYATPDDLDEPSERHATRFCEALGRALSEQMGRGRLYRVDLRLRPYGGAGPISRSIGSIEGYYDRYAEPWEIQALLRSRPIAGDPNMAARWLEMRRRVCFRPQVSEIAIESMVAMRRRIEDGASPRDLKRGAGGIRDVEFLVQILQLVDGAHLPGLESANTLETIHWLEQGAILDHATASTLADGYTFLRKLEHRIQALNDRQTHELPEDPDTLGAIASMMRVPDAAALETELARRRRAIHAVYEQTLRASDAPESERRAALSSLGPLAVAAAPWFDVLPEPESYYRSLLENESSSDRVRRILERAPVLAKAFQASVGLTDLLLSGEIEEGFDPVVRIDGAPLDASTEVVAQAIRNAQAIVCARWTLDPESIDLPTALTRLAESVVRRLFSRLAPNVEVFALGSFSCYEMAPGSDADLLLLVPRAADQPAAEHGVQRVMAAINDLRRFDVDFSIDLRLRPDGRKGLLVRTHAGFRSYDFEGMEMWERFALGHARAIVAGAEAREMVFDSAYGLPLTPERLKSLVAMKRRIETERVAAHHVDRDVKLGRGGLNDIEWLVHLTEMRYPGATLAGTTTRFDDRIRSLGRAGLLNVLEVDRLLEARRHLLDLRSYVILQGLDRSLLPENPDKLDRLAHSMGLADGNSLLAVHQPIRVFVRQVYQETLERLRA